jgi:glycosyltransferase involved in cell wall biosynthesis
MVSLIVPTHNEESAIEKTLAQLSRVRGRFEALVVDGQSTDQTQARVAAASRDFPSRASSFLQSVWFRSGGVS